MHSRLDPWQAELSFAPTGQAGRPGCVSCMRRPSAPKDSPEGAGIAHTFVLHPPSGIAQDDQLRYRDFSQQVSHSVYATPGATRRYRSFQTPLNQPSKASFINVSQNRPLSGFRNENLYFNQAWAKNSLEVRLEPGCRLLGWDLQQFGCTSCCNEPC